MHVKSNSGVLLPLVNPDWSPVATIRCDYQSAGRRKDGKYVNHDSIPHLCHIELTYACNERCVFCYNPEHAKLGDLSVIDLIVRSVAESQVPHVYLIGGEPSLLPVEKLNEYIEILSEHSSVTIVTNGLRRLKGISNKLACFGVPIHGAEAETHEFLNQSKGSFKKTLETIKHYVGEGHDVRCIPVLTAFNFDQIYDIICVAANLGMESIYVDRYEDGGVGATNSLNYHLKPTRDQFQTAVGQIIRAKHDFTVFKGKIGFGTAIPYCLDERMITEGITSNCGVGTYFCAINPRGEFRMCNQSQLVFGTLPDESIESIWNKPTLDIFRDLSWVSEPCKSCGLLLDCTGGCKVDANCSDKFCIDYSVRDPSSPVTKLVTKVKHCRIADTYPTNYRVFHPNRYAKLTTRYPEKFLVTRYQTVKLDEMALEMTQTILDKSFTNELALVSRFSDRVEEHEIRLFVSKMLQVGAIDLSDIDSNSAFVQQKQNIETLTQFHAALDDLYQDVECDCRECQDPDCMGFIWLLGQEVERFYELGIPLVQVNNGPTFIHSFPTNTNGQLNLSVRYPPCSRLCDNGRRCSIYPDRPMVCRLYPLGFETKADGAIVWAVHQDCLYIRRLKERDLLSGFEHRARNIINNLSPRLLEEIVKTYRAVDAITFFPYGENNYTFLQEIHNVQVQTGPGR
jgi:radical SAM protein with 4Fe4S-binding SPASM domain